MKLLNCYLLDDMTSTKLTLETYIDNHEGLHFFGYESDPKKFIQYFESGLLPIDILFLDIEMPGITGLEVAARFKDKFHIIFLTAHRNFALEAFELNAVDYLLKPISELRFNQAISKIIDNPLKPSYRDQSRFITINSKMDGIWTKILLSEILYFKSDSNYITIQLLTESFVYIHSLEKIEQEYLGQGFVRVHRSYVVNKLHVHRKFAKYLTMIDGTRIPIGRSFRESASRILNT